jgi:hypothetical protein
MKVLVERKEDIPPRVKIFADWEIADKPDTIDEWIRNLQLAKAWLRRKQKK